VASEGRVGATVARGSMDMYSGTLPGGVGGAVVGRGKTSPGGDLRERGYKNVKRRM